MLPPLTRGTTVCPRHRNGFTLSEILVVVAVVGLLIGLLLPAIHAAREASRRAQCMSRQKQLAVAALNYESARNTFAVGSHNTFWKTWVVQLAPFCEMPDVSNRYNGRLYLAESRCDADSNVAVTTQRLPQLACPDDPPVLTTFGNGLSAHSYVACTGNGGYVNTPIGWNTTPPTPYFYFYRANPGASVAGIQLQLLTRQAFAFRGGIYQMSGGNADLAPPEDPSLLRPAVAMRSREITDGVSKTLAFSEVIHPADQPKDSCQDFRGLTWWGPGALFSTVRTPNSSNPDVMPADGDCLPDSEAPCACPHTGLSPIAIAARSRHPGGVVAAMCDSSVDFYANDIDALVWQQMGTACGDDVVATSVSIGQYGGAGLPIQYTPPISR